MKAACSPSIFLTVGMFLIAVSGEFFKAGTMLVNATGIPNAPWLPWVCIIAGSGFVLDAVYKSSAS